jgi:hypothetical protein
MWINRAGNDQFSGGVDGSIGWEWKLGTDGDNFFAIYEHIGDIIIRGRDNPAALDQN